MSLRGGVYQGATVRDERFAAPLDHGIASLTNLRSVQL